MAERGDLPLDISSLTLSGASGPGSPAPPSARNSLRGSMSAGAGAGLRGSVRQSFDHHQVYDR